MSIVRKAFDYVKTNESIQLMVNKNFMISKAPRTPITAKTFKLLFNGNLPYSLRYMIDVVIGDLNIDLIKQVLKVIKYPKSLIIYSEIDESVVNMIMRKPLLDSVILRKSYGKLAKHPSFNVREQYHYCSGIPYRHILLTYSEAYHDVLFRSDNSMTEEQIQTLSELFRADDPNMAFRSFLHLAMTCDDVIGECNDGIKDILSHKSPLYECPAKYLYTRFKESGLDSKFPGAFDVFINLFPFNAAKIWGYEELLDRIDATYKCINLNEANTLFDDLLNIDVDFAIEYWAWVVTASQDIELTHPSVLLKYPQLISMCLLSGKDYEYYEQSLGDHYKYTAFQYLTNLGVFEYYKPTLRELDVSVVRQTKEKFYLYAVHLGADRKLMSKEIEQHLYGYNAKKEISTDTPIIDILVKHHPYVAIRHSWYRSLFTLDHITCLCSDIFWELRDAYNCKPADMTLCEYIGDQYSYVRDNINDERFDPDDFRPFGEYDDNDYDSMVWLVELSDDMIEKFDLMDIYHNIFTKPVNKLFLINLIEDLMADVEWMNSDRIKLDLEIIKAD